MYLKPVSLPVFLLKGSMSLCRSYQKGKNDMCPPVKGIFLRYIVCFLGTAFFLWALFTLSACIPRSALSDNLQSSADYYSRHDNFFELREGVYETTVDYYADAYLYNIIIHIDTSHPVSSVLEARYSRTDDDDSIAGLMKAIAGEDANESYTRYWHGSTMILTLLLLWMDAERIYIFLTVILVLLLLLLVVQLYRRKRYELLFSLTLAILLCKGWMVTKSLEYMFPCLVCLVISNLTLWLCQRKKNVMYLWIISGCLICFVDFLTTETITILIPMMIYIVDEYCEMKDTRKCIPVRASHNTCLRQAGFFRQDMKDAVAMCISWFLAYAGMWLMKWGIASFVLGRNIFTETAPYAAFRINDNSYMQYGAVERYMGALLRNIRCVFPFCFVHTYGETLAMLCVAGLLLAGVVIMGSKRKEEIRLVLVLLFLSVIPYLRYLTLSAHSYVHAFFTYRAQMATIMGVTVILWILLKKKALK